MKRIIISEEEKRRIMGLYEQTQPTTGTTSLDLSKYKDTIIDMINRMNGVFQDAVLCDVCKDIESKMKPIYTSIDNLILAIKTDLKTVNKKEYTDGQAIEEVYNSFKNNSSKLFGTILTALKVFTNIKISEEVADKVAEYLNKKENGGLLNTIISEIFTKAGIQRVKFCASC